MPPIIMNRTRWQLLALVIVPLALFLAAAPLSAQSPQPAPIGGAAVQPKPPHPLLGDVRIRRALAFCTDREDLVQSVYSPLTSAESQLLMMDTFIPKNHWLYTAPPAEYRYPFDPAQGRALLEEAGWTLAPDATYRTNAEGYQLAVGLTTTSAQFRETWAEALEAQWRDQCGIRLVRSHISASVFFGSGAGGLVQRDFEQAAFAWVDQGLPRGLTAYGCDYIPSAGNNWRGQNYMGWCNPTADAALKRAQNTLDRPTQVAEYATVQTEFARDMVSLPLFHRLETYGARAALQNYRPGAAEYDTWNIHAWSLPGVTTLVIRGEEPPSLYRFDTSGAFARLEWLLFEKGVSQADYDFQPALLTELPLVGGLAHGSDVTVEEGDAVVDVDGSAVALAPGVVIQRADGQQVTYAGGPVQMKQYVVPYFFHPELRWSDGQPLKQADIDLAYRHDCDPAAQSFIESTCAAIASVVTANTAYTVTYKPGYQDPAYFKPPFLFYPSHQVILSDGPYQGKTLAEVPTADWSNLLEIMKQPIGVGPYRLKSWREKGEMVFEQNPYYWRGANTLRFQEIHVVFNVPFDQAAQQLEAGTLHVMPDLPTTSSPDVTIYKVASATWEHMDMNLELYRQAVARHMPASGGELATAVGISVTVSPGATAAGADFVLNDIAAPTQKFQDAQVPVRAFTVQSFDGANQPISRFAQPLTIQVTYSDEDLQARGLDENSINIAYWDGNAWNRILPCAGCTVDHAANRVTFAVSHLTEFALTASTQLFLPCVRTR